MKKRRKIKLVRKSNKIQKQTKKKLRKSNYQVKRNNRKILNRKQEKQKILRVKINLQY